MRADHRERVAADDDDRGVDAREFAREHEMQGRRDPALAVRRVEPVDAPEVARIHGVRVDVLQSVRRSGRLGRGVGELGERRQGDLPIAEPGDRVVVRRLVDHVGCQPEAEVGGEGSGGEGGSGGVGNHGPAV